LGPAFRGSVSADIGRKYFLDIHRQDGHQKRILMPRIIIPEGLCYAAALQSGQDMW
jgi:hypothetical protein